MKIQTITILLITLFFTVTLNAKDCNFETIVKNGKTVTKSEPLELQGNRASVWFTFTKTDTLANLMAMSWEDDINFKGCDLVMTFQNKSKTTIKYNEFSGNGPDVFLDLTPETFGADNVFKLFEKNKITELNLINRKSKKSIVRVKLNKANSKFITDAFYCFTKN